VRIASIAASSSLVTEMTITNLGEGRYWLISAAAGERHDEHWLREHLPADGSVRVDTYRDWIRQYISDHDVLPPDASCNADGMCASGCAAFDPDCPCAADSFCTAACGDVGSDPDCTGCLAGDVCRTDCPALDTDCCATDGACNDACGAMDEDCAPPDNGNTDGDGKGDSSGCTTGGSAGWFAGLVVTLLLVRRRRRQSPGTRSGVSAHPLSRPSS